MKNLVVLGLQWGDEGKGKIVDRFAKEAKAVIRYNGGSNAGHTIYVDGKKIVSHLVPTGVLEPSVKLILTAGVMISLRGLVGEIKDIMNMGYNVLDRMYISEDASVILPFHELLDSQNVPLDKKGSIGTTGKGIGPATSDKYFRRGIKVWELRDKDRFVERISGLYDIYTSLLKSDSPLPSKEEMIAEIYGYFDFIKDRVVNTEDMIFDMVDNDDVMIFEGAQGSLLDIEYGDYPYLTSSHTTIGGVITGAGLSHKQIGEVCGVFKAYTTKVGNGAFPTEDTGFAGEYIRKMGAEFGSTTGRPRRCGWLDLVALKYAIRLSGVDKLIMTKLDVLTGLDEIKICTGYEVDGKRIKNWIKNDIMLNNVRPVYETFNGWKDDIGSIRSEKDLPKEARDFIAFIEREVKVKISMVSVGTGRDDLVSR